MMPRMRSWRNNISFGIERAPLLAKHGEDDMTGDESRAVETGATVRPLTGDDLDRVVAIDRKLSGRARRGFFESRLAAALRDPGGFITVGVCDGDDLLGFAMTRLQEGDFGIEVSVAVLDAIGVDPDHHGAGLGRRLMAGIEDVMRRKGVHELHSQLDWHNHSLLRFLDSAGFELASSVVLGRTTAAMEAFREDGGRL